MIGILHGRKPKPGSGKIPSGFASLAGEEIVPPPAAAASSATTDSIRADVDATIVAEDPSSEHEIRRREEWRANLRLLLVCFLISGLCTLATYFFPIIRNVPLFGSAAASTWLWTFNPSLAYIGQGVIMGPATTMHMLLGAVVGWAVLSPLAKNRGWAPGNINDWETGSKGWIVWISIAIMLADGIVSLTHIAVRSGLQYWPGAQSAIIRNLPQSIASKLQKRDTAGYTAVNGSDDTADAAPVSPSPLANFRAPETGLGGEDDGLHPTRNHDEPLDENSERDAPLEQQIGSKIVSIGLVLSILFCIACIRITFGPLVPLYATVISIAMALVLSIMGVRALGEVRLRCQSFFFRSATYYTYISNIATNASRPISTLYPESLSSRSSSLL